MKTPDSNTPSSKPDSNSKEASKASATVPKKKRGSLQTNKGAKAKAKGGKSKTDNSNMFSVRGPKELFSLVEILKAQLPDKAKLGDELTKKLKRGMELEEEAQLTRPALNHPTLAGAEYIRLRQKYAKVIKVLKNFRSDLLQIDQYPDDDERAEEMAKLFQHAEESLQSANILNTRLARIALLPEIPNGDVFFTLLDLRNFLQDRLNQTSCDREKAQCKLGLKIIGPYLP